MPDALERLPSRDFSMAGYALTPAPLTRLLAEGDHVDTGDRRFRVLHLPGHSPGSIALLDEVNGEMFSGDAIYDDELVDDIAGSDIPAYVATMRRLAGLHVRAVHGGHGESFDGARMREIAENYVEVKSMT
jgi:glyoxylase-like metal-dependent hydrolase (beta-lactamase superfamily II)